jgi:hypothetical protein
MVLAWSTTEVIRYAFYAFSVLGLEPYPLLWLRYTTFYVLYPLGAASEAFTMLSTVPRVSPLTPEGRTAWTPEDFVRLGLFALWWPGEWRGSAFFLRWQIGTDGAVVRRAVCDVHAHDEAAPQGIRREQVGRCAEGEGAVMGQRSITHIALSALAVEAMSKILHNLQCVNCASPLLYGGLKKSNPADHAALSLPAVSRLP